MDSLGQYELLDRIVGTASSTVYRARDRRLDRIVAIKSLDATTSHLREQWRTEARILATLSHPNVVQVLGFHEDDAGAYIVEEWIEGASLAGVLAATGAMPPAQALGVARGALLGLSDVHRHGLVHADISPSNILLDRSGTSKLIDFGLTSGSGSPGRPATGAYQAPEVALGAPVTPASDVYSAAAVVAMLLRGRASAQPVVDDVDLTLRPVLATALDPEPTRRYVDAAAFLAALESAAERRYGASWWTQAGLGAAAVSAAATVVAVVPVLVGAWGGQPPVGGPPAQPTSPTSSPGPSPSVRPVSRAARLGTRARVLITAGTVSAVGVAIAVVVLSHHADPNRASAVRTPPITVAPAVNSPTAISPATAPSASPGTGVVRIACPGEPILLAAIRITRPSIRHVSEIQCSGEWAAAAVSDANNASAGLFRFVNGTWTVVSRQGPCAGRTFADPDPFWRRACFSS